MGGLVSRRLIWEVCLPPVLSPCVVYRSTTSVGDEAFMYGILGQTLHVFCSAGIIGGNGSVTVPVSQDGPGTIFNHFTLG
jgi:hypothetical protein